MRIIENETAWDTRAVRRVLTATYRAFVKRESKLAVWPELRVRLLERRISAVPIITNTGANLLIHLPRLRGGEFVALARQQHGGAQAPDAEGLTATQIVLEMQPALYRLGHLIPPSWTSKITMGNLHKLEQHIPIRIIGPKPVRDKQRERLQRAVESEKRWRTKAKLAATKIKKLGQLRKRLEKQIAAREAVA